MIKTKRWNERRSRDDGIRLLVCRYRPRALRKDKETWDLWWPHLGPSPGLHADFYGKHGAPISWEEFRRRFLEEIQGQEESLALLAEKVAAGQTLTLLCSKACVDESHCHRSLLRQLIEERVRRIQSGEQCGERGA